MIVLSRLLPLVLFVALCVTKPLESFLHTPCEVTSLEYTKLQQLTKDKTIHFTWRDPLFEFGISHKDTCAYFMLSIDTSLYNKLSDTIKRQFIELGDNHKFQFVYTYGCALKISYSSSQEDALNYSVASPYQSQGKPQLITVQELAQLIKNQRVLFYTGAGISASVVPAMEKLEHMIGFTRNGRRPDGIRTVTTMISDPDKVAQNFASFVQATIEAPPTAGHKALALLAKYKKTSILTENIDLLQQAAGIEPLFTGSQKAHDLCTAHNFQEIDLLICIGLSHDDRGFIAQYKHHNPNAKIVALDFKSPNYLDNDDRLLQGDIQVNLPMLYNEVTLEYNLP